ncbi:TraB/GumN family protein [Roseomonas frigidaquae]|uniref:TraB/GumN family protein n=1 Tax=Falsiroseomonas frigidaquae TaxID=487318 RepID=A0ABX1F6Z5_9PROT|nr:TraB/GumN family protein [Falsiroseomonas frigidaquae]NKE48144.1 TraB/GumN family protein [Falsiroseomonas frigidaquae]
MRRLLLLAVLAAPLAQAETLAAFHITPAGRDAPQSLLIPGSHQGEAGLPSPAPSILDGRDALLLESVPETEDVSDLLRAPRGFDVLAPFPPDQRRLLEAASACARLGVEPLSPVGLFLSLLAATAPRDEPCPGLPAPSAATGEAPSGGDPSLRALAEARGIPVQGLETRREQLTALRQMGGDALLRMVALMLREMQRGGPPAGLSGLDAAMVSALREGDFAALRERTLATLAADPPLRAAFARFMLDARSALMARQLAARLPRESLVIGIGGAHASGPGGVVARLRQAGFTVEPIRIPALAPPP